MATGPDITELPAAWQGENREALDALVPLVLDELKWIAGAYLAREEHARGSVYGGVWGCMGSGVWGQRPQFPVFS